MLLLIDNYDSFVYNIYHWLPYDSNRINIIRNDQIDPSAIKKQNVEGLIISPGPMGPAQTGKVLDLLDIYWDKIPILGICLGHQTIGHYFSCNVIQSFDPVHGEAHSVNLKKSRIYEGLSEIATMGRYHSLIVSEEGFNHEQLKINASLDNGIIMGIEHNKYPIFGVQFHPESVLSAESGRRILNNFINELIKKEGESNAKLN